MTSLNRRGTLIGVVCLAIASQMACSQPLYVRATGSLAEGVIFGLYRAVGDKETTAFTIVGVAVIRRNTDGGGTSIWNVKGRQTLSAIRYGESPNGMTEDSPAQELRPGRYQIFVDTADNSRKGGIIFDIRPDGMAAEFK